MQAALDRARNRPSLDGLLLAVLLGAATLLAAAALLVTVTARARPKPGPRTAACTCGRVCTCKPCRCR